MAKTKAEQEAQQRYAQSEKGQEKLREARQRYEKKRGYSGRAEYLRNYMREYQRRKKEQATQAGDTPTTDE